MEKRAKRTSSKAAAKGGALASPKRTRMAMTVFVFFIALALGFQIIARRDELLPEASASKVTECDRLAAHPSDTERLSPGVEQPEVNILAAKKACHDALKSAPGNGRILYQLGRAYFYNDEKDKGIGYFKQSDTAGYAQGQFDLGLVYAQGNGIAPDICQAGALWLKAAHQRHLYSKIVLINNWMQGQFKGCDLPLTEQELDGMVSQAIELANADTEQDDVRQLRRNWDQRKR